MYKVYCDGLLIFDPSNDEQKYVIEEAKLSLADNSSGTFEFTISPGAVGYGAVEKMVSEIIVYRDEEEIWSGRVTTEREDFWKRRKYHAEGELSYLNDTIVQEQIDYTGSPLNGLKLLLDKHNAKVESNRTIHLGTVTVTQKISFNDGYKTTWAMIEDKFINAIGGHMIIRKSGSTRYLDYYDDWPTTSSQTIEFGKNLLDYAKDFDMTDFATAVLARGATKDDGAQITIASVNGGNPFYERSSLISMYGRIEKIKEWGEIDDPELLYDTVERYMNDSLYNDLSLELSVVDLHDLNADISAFHLLDKVHCVSEPHGMDRYLPLTELSLDLNDPSKTKISLNTEKRKELSHVIKETKKEIEDVEDKMPKEGTILEKAQKAAAALINACTNGYITIVHNEDHASELIISEKRVWDEGKYWRWNYNGLGFFVNNEQVSVAMTMDGQIVANAITTGEMSAARIKGGTLTLGNYDNINGELVILDAEGNQIGKWDMSGIYAKNGTFEGTIKNGNFTDYGVEISSGIIKGYMKNQNTTYISSNQTIEDTNGTPQYGLRIASQGGISIRAPRLGVSKEFIGPTTSGTVYFGVDSTIRPITNLQTIGEGENRKLQFTYGDVRFLNGICISTTDGVGTSTTDLPEQQAPVGDNTYQADAEEMVQEHIIDTAFQERAIDESKFVPSNEHTKAYSISWQKDLIINCNDVRKTNTNCPHFSNGWIDIATGYGGDFPIIRSFPGPYNICSDSTNDIQVSQYGADNNVLKTYYTSKPLWLVYVGQNNGYWYVSEVVRPAGGFNVRMFYRDNLNISPPTTSTSLINAYGNGPTIYNSRWPINSGIPNDYKGWMGYRPKQLDRLFTDLYPVDSAEQGRWTMYTDNNFSRRYSLATGNYLGIQVFWQSNILFFIYGICFKEDNRVYWSDVFTDRDGRGKYYPMIDPAQIYNTQVTTKLNVNLTKNKLYAFDDLASAESFRNYLITLKE